MQLRDELIMLSWIVGYSALYYSQSTWYNLTRHFEHVIGIIVVMTRTFAAVVANVGQSLRLHAVQINVSTSSKTEHS
jgi:hypothetical protein